MLPRSLLGKACSYLLDYWDVLVAHQQHAFTLGNTAGLVSDFNSASNYSFTLVTTTGGITGFDASAFFLDASAFANPFTGTWSISTSNGGNALSLNYSGMSVVPEPSTYAA